jgi:hypothetical protein
MAGSIGWPLARTAIEAGAYNALAYIFIRSQSLRFGRRLLNGPGESHVMDGTLIDGRHSFRARCLVLVEIEMGCVVVLCDQ